MNDFEKGLAEFQKCLLESQEDLEPEFRKVLDDNLWDLYVCDKEDENNR